MYTENIQNAIIPIPLISSCGLLLLALYNRFFWTVDRLRKFDRELLHEYEVPQDHRSQTNRRVMELFESQIQSLKKRANLLKFSIMCVLLSNLATIGVCFVTLIKPDNVFVLVLVYSSLSLIGCGLFLAFIEMSIALFPVLQEAHIVTKELSNVDFRRLVP